MGKALPTFKNIALRDDAFCEGHTLCPGCMEAITFNTIGRATDNKRKTVFTMGTFCGEVSRDSFSDTRTYAYDGNDLHFARIERHYL